MTTWKLRVHHGPTERAVVLNADPNIAAAGIRSALSAVGVDAETIYLDGQEWGAVGELGESRLANGSLISTQPGTQRDVVPGTYLVVIGGPRSGDAALITPGSSVAVGRETSGGLTIPDSLLSRNHFEVEVGLDGAVTVRDLGSTNGTIVEESSLTERVIEDGDVIQAGASLFTVAHIGSEDRATVLDSTATGLNMQRQFREAKSELGKAAAEPRKPVENKGGLNNTWWRSLMPLVSGVGFAILFDRWEFLMVMAIAPIIYTIDNQRRKKRQKLESEADLEQYYREMDEYHASLAALRREQVRRSRLEQLGGGMAALLARFRHRRLWERSPNDEDFAAVTLGFAKLHTDDGSKNGGQLWAAPLSISLPIDGPIGIIGPTERAEGVLRSMLTELVFLQSPTDVEVWVFADENNAQAWEFVRWLPHAETSHGGARLATTREGRSAQIRSLLGLIESRTDLAANNQNVSLPLQVVIIEGLHTVATADLTEILRKGQLVGVHGIIADGSIVPEGIRATVQLGLHDDECTFRSATIPRVEEVVVSQVSHEHSRAAALELAPLEVYNPVAVGRPTSTVYFTDLVRFGTRSPQEQATFWAEHSPQTNVPIGITMDGEVLSLDFVKQGPHGLIGGMTRSGKTEFLKTLFASLALHNHPDDLSISIIDFKGGVDHRMTADLPHVIDLATNQNIDRFERTLQLLSAEQTRRQRIFDNAEVGTLEAYRSARENNPMLENVPRLLVVVDEFMELMQTPEGKAQIGRLESVTRIGAGLGVHLLLVTQNFDGQLPPQIAGQAGFRVCFKVESGSDSKTVIGTGVAETISANTKGRAFGRFMGGDVIEFQSARIGNRARIDGIDDEIVMRDAPIEGLAIRHGDEIEPEVPGPEQDLHKVIEIACKAAKVDGFREPSVPWPSGLPDQLILSELPQPGVASSPVIGLGDNPMMQRIESIVLDCDEAVVAFAGSPDSGHHAALIGSVVAACRSASPNDLHVYGIDVIGQGLAWLAPLPHVGGVATRDDSTASRVLTWLISEAARRRSHFAEHGASDYADYVRRGNDDYPRIKLVVLGADRLFLHSEGASSPLLAPMTTLLNEVASTGIQVLMSGSTLFLANRLGMASGRRFVFAANDPGEYPSTVPKDLRASLVQRMRCYDSESGHLAQMAAVSGGEMPTGELLAEVGAQMHEAITMVRPPRSFVVAPWPLRMRQIEDATLKEPPHEMLLPLPFGIDPDTEQVFWLDADEDGSSYRIVGGPKSGRSSAIAAIAEMGQSAGWRVVVVAPSRRSRLHSIESMASLLRPADNIAAITGELSANNPTLLLIDDVHRLGDDFDWTAVTDAERGSLVTVVAGATEFLTKSTGVVRTIGCRNGMVLMPAKQRDVTLIDASGASEDWFITPREGVGVAAIAGESFRIQLPLVD